MSQVIIALDFPDACAALGMVEKIGESGQYYKVGLELFISEGHIILPELKRLGKKVFLDLKLHDIPNTAASALKSCLNYDIDMVNIHIQGGIQMMEACADVISSSSNKPLLIGVTLLTSLDNDYLNTYKINSGSSDYVVYLSMLAQQCGLVGVVSSAKEVQYIKAAAGKDFITVTPGIRLDNDLKGDQRRVLTPSAAACTGTDFMVIGRSITGSQDPAGTVKDILRSIGVSNG